MPGHSSWSLSRSAQATHDITIAAAADKMKTMKTTFGPNADAAGRGLTLSPSMYEIALRHGTVFMKPCIRARSRCYSRNLREISPEAANACRG